MNLLKQLWDKLVNKTSVRPTLVLVEEEAVAEILTSILIESGVNTDYIQEHLVGRFEEWYDGEPTAEAIRDSIADFKESLPDGLHRNVNRQQRAHRYEQ